MSMSVRALAAVTFALVSYSPGVRASSVKVIYDFLGDKAGGPNLGDPTAGLTQDAAGNLYGTVLGFEGGSTRNPARQGAVFELVRPSAGSSVWSEKTLFQMPMSATGVFIAAGVRFDGRGNLYGIAIGSGGAGAGGFMFKLAPPADGSSTWTETVLSQPFTDPSATPLIGADHVLYVSDITGVFTVSPPVKVGGAWTTQRIYSFPYVGKATSLISDAKGDIYGALFPGDPTSTNLSFIFQLAPPVKSGGAWTAANLYSFPAGDAFGTGPLGNLVFGPGGALYGTTAHGGPSDGSGGGTIFQLTPPVTSGDAWTATTLYAFNYPGPFYPTAGLTLTASGIFYGTTGGGGTNGGGTVFSFTLGANGAAPKLTTLANFTNSTKALNQPEFPMTPLLKGVDGMLYGTTGSGGRELCAAAQVERYCGTVFQIAP